MKVNAKEVKQVKKSLSLLLLVSIFLCLLSSCNGIGNYYSVNVTGDKDSLMEPIMPVYQAGKMVEIKAHPVTDISLHVFVNGKEIYMSHYDSDYWGFEFVMPEENVNIHLTYDQFYGRDEYEFNDLHSLEFLKNKITKVSIRKTNYSKKNSFIETRYSFKQEDIDNFKVIFEQKLIKSDNNIASNAIYGNEYSFYYNTESHGERVDILEFNDTFFAWNDFASWQAFKFEDENYVLPTIENPDLVTYSFKYDGRSSNVKRYDDESFSLQYFNIGSVEFIPYEGEPLAIEAKFYLDSSYGKINLFTPTVFELNGEYYEIISGMESWAYNYHQLEGK